jgi:Phage tail lysozyme
MEFMDRIEQMGQKKAFLRGLGLDEALANLTGPERKAALADIKKNIGSLSDEARKKGLEAAGGFDKLRESIEHLRTEVGANLAGDAAAATTKIAEFISGKGPELVKVLRDMATGAGEFVKGAGLMGEALDQLRKQDPVDLTKLVDFTGFDRTFEVFMQTWKARWLGFKSVFGGDQGAADAAEVERRRLLKKDFPEEFEREEKARRNEQERGLQGGLPFSGRWPVPDIQSERIMPPGEFGKGKDTRPLWRRLFDMTDQGGGATPAAFRVEGPNPLLGPGGGGGERMLEGAVERGSRKGVYSALWDFARGQPGGGGGGGGGSAGEGMRAIRANFSGAAGAAGEPSTDGGAGTGGGASRSPMGTLGGKPVGVTSIGGGAGGGGGAMRLMKGLVSRGWSPKAAAMMAGNVHAESGFNPGTVGDHGTSFGLAQWHNERATALKSAAKAAGKDWKDFDFQTGFLDKEFRGRFGDKAVASHDFGALSQMGKRFEGYGTNTYGARVAAGQRFLKQYGAGGKAPHFNVADIRRSLAGTGGDQLTGVGGYNFMGSARARAMGMGDVTHGGPLAHMTWPTGIPKGEGPTSILANKYAGADMAGFLKDLHDAGAPLKQFAGAYVNKPLQHGYGNALDIETGFGSGPDNSPLLYAWAQKHPKEFAAIQAQHHMRNLDTSSGAGMHDWGHFEWSPEGKKQVEEAAKATKRPNFGHRAHPDLLGHARDAGFAGQPMQHKVSGSASLDINVNGPKGTEAKMRRLDGLFKDARINRGPSMPRASENG